MALKTCPRCEETAFEHMETYGVCHGCNFNTEEGYSWQTHSKRMHPRYPPETEAEISEGLERMKASGRTNPLFSDADYRLARLAIAELPRPEKEVVLLKFWGRHDTATIAERLGLRLGTVESLLSKACEKIKSACINHPAFSRAHATHAAA